VTASLLNVSSFSTPGVGPGGGAPAGGVQDAGAAFEAMMAAFLGQITAPEAGAAAEAAETAPAEEGEQAETAETAANPDQPALEINAAVVAALAEATPVQPQAQPTAAAVADAALAQDAGAKAPAWGHGKAAALPAAPALQHANPNAAFLQEALAGEADAGEAALPSEADAASPLEPQPPKAQGRPASAGSTLPSPAAIAAAAPQAPAQAPTQALQGLDAAAPVAALAPEVAASADAAAEAQAPAATQATSGAAQAEAARPAPRDKGEAKVERKAGDRVDAFADGGPERAQAVAAAGRAAPVHAKADVAKPGAQGPQDALLPETAAAQPAAAEFQTAEAAPAAEAPRHASNAESATTQAAAQVRGSPETVANLSAQILKKLDARSTRFDVQLDPLGLGKVDVRVEIGAHGKMTAALSFENPQAAQELKARASELQRALEQAGFDLSGGMSFDVAGDQGRPSQGFLGDHGGQDGGAFRGRAFRAAIDTANEADVAALANGPLTLRRGVNAGLDVRI
jgi:hypothetical protein